MKKLLMLFIPMILTSCYEGNSGSDDYPYSRACVDGIFYVRPYASQGSFTLQVDEKGMPVTCDEPQI